MFASSLLAQDFAEQFAKIDLKDVDQVTQAITLKESVRATVKVAAINRLAAIYRKEQSKADGQVPQFLQAIATAMDLHKDDTDPNNYTIRVASCYALNAFDSSGNATNAIQTAGKTLLEDSHLEVKSACAKSLGEFQKNKEPATKQLLEKLDMDYKKKDFIKREVWVATFVIRSLGKLGSKQAFIPMMKVIQSDNFYVENKKEAQLAIEKIVWN